MKPFITAVAVILSVLQAGCFANSGRSSGYLVLDGSDPALEKGIIRGAGPGSIRLPAFDAQGPLVVFSRPPEGDPVVPAGDSWLVFGAGKPDDGVGSFRYREEDLAFLMGFLAGRLAEGPVVGMLAAEDYPLLETHVRPAFEAGLYRADPAIRCEFLTLESDGTITDKVAGLRALGAGVVFSVSGDADVSVAEAAAAAGCLVLLLDDGGQPAIKGVTLAGHRRAEKAGREITRQFLEGMIPAGEDLAGGIREGYLVFPENGSAYRRAVPPPIRREIRSLVTKMKKGLIQVVKPVYG